MLLCGAASSLLYIATDIIGGLQYTGYSFASQAISELNAVGSPAAAVVSPLYAVYGVLVLAFGLAVFREADGRNRSLKATGSLLSAYGAVGIVAALVEFTGSAFFKMHQRGTATISADAPHIVLTAVLVILLLAMFVSGSFALDKRFRVYSYATLATVILFAGLTAMYAPQLAAGQPTPGLGILERINVYAAVIWPGVLAIALLRPRSPEAEARLQ